LRSVAIAFALVLAIVVVPVLWGHARTHRARSWTREVPSSKRETVFATAKLQAATFGRSDWQCLCREALRLDSTAEIWIRAHRSRFPGWAAPLLPADTDFDLRWRALTFAWISCQKDLLQRREDLLRMALNAPDAVRWRSVDLVFQDQRRKSGPTDLTPHSLSPPMLGLLQRLAKDRDPRVRIHVALALQWPAPGAEATIGELLERLALDPDSATASTANRILALRPSKP